MTIQLEADRDELKQAYLALSTAVTDCIGPVRFLLMSPLVYKGLTIGANLTEEMNKSRNRDVIPNDSIKFPAGLPAPDGDPDNNVLFIVDSTLDGYACRGLPSPTFEFGAWADAMVRSETSEAH